jgi:hypothetical protein
MAVRPDSRRGRCGRPVLPVEFQRTLARDRLGVEADVLPGGHLIALARPLGLAEYLLNV